MKQAAKKILLATLLGLGALAAQPALAGGYYHGGYYGHGYYGPRVAIGLNFGYPLGYAYPYPSYPAYYPAPVVMPQQPSVYVEQQPAPAAAQPQGSWYYCASSGAYYPYVKECPAGWQRVAPQPG